MGWYSFRPYVSVSQRRENAAREILKRRKKGEKIEPVALQGRKITQTFWGTAWCENLESYSDFDTRLPRGRTYIRNGSVVHLQVLPGKIAALVSGSDLYKITVDIDPLDKESWKDIRNQCAGQIGSVVELLQGKLSKHVMEVVTRRPNGLFPKPLEIRMKCSCPDWAIMCKHVAAAMYGVGARLDEQPELLFKLRQVDHFDLIQSAGAAPTIRATSTKPAIAAADLADVFGIEMAPNEAEESAKVDKPPVTQSKKPAVRSPVKKPIPKVVVVKAKAKKRKPKKRATRQKTKTIPTLSY